MFPEADVYLEALILDNSGVEIGSSRREGDWGEALVVDSMLADPLHVTPQREKAEKRGVVAKRVIGAIPNIKPLNRDGPVEFTIKEQAWDTTSSQCTVGDWDNGMNGEDLLDPSPDQGFPVSFLLL